MPSKGYSGINNNQTKSTQTSASPIATSDKTLLNYYTNKGAYDEVQIFDKNYSQALTLMGGDRLLKPSASLNTATIRKTTTDGLYKVISHGMDATFAISYIDETELLNDRKYSFGTVSKLGEDEYEITYFDSEDEIIIEHYNKQEVIDFMKENKLIFQL